jgi:hypothetical protein
MDCGPGQPGKESAQVDLTALHNGKAFAHHCHVTFIEVAERRQRRFPLHPSPNQLSRVASLLHGNLSDTGQRLAVLL